MSARSAWLRFSYLWLVPAVVVLINAVWLIGLRGAVLGRGSLLEKQRATVQADVVALEAQRDRLTTARLSLDTLQQNLDTLRKEQLGSMRERLVSFLVDVARRTQTAGLRPDRIAYSAQPDRKSGLVHFAAVFSVIGSYEQVRRCINLLEASPQFVMVERLALRSDDENSSLAVNVQLTIGTYFTDADTGMLRELGIEEQPAGATTASSPAAGGAGGELAGNEPAPTDFTAVDNRVMSDLRAAVSGLAPAETTGETDLFTAPEPDLDESARRRPRPNTRQDRNVRGDAFVQQLGTREVSRGR